MHDAQDHTREIGLVSEAARRARLGERFRYWRGQSGQAYLFTEVPVAEVTTFRDVVVLFATPVAAGNLAMSHATEIDADGNWADPAAADAAYADGRVAIFVHLLATGDRERASVLADLAGDRRLAAAA